MGWGKGLGDGEGLKTVSSSTPDKHATRIPLGNNCFCCCVVVLRPGKHLRSCRDGQLT